MRVGSENNITILIDGVVTLDSVNDTLLLANFLGQVTRIDQNLAGISFANGFSINITQNFDLLTFEIQSPSSFNGMFKGLVGNADGDPTNDFVHRNGALTSSNASDSQIHQFGLSCKFMFKFSHILSTYMRKNSSKMSHHLISVQNNNL